MIELVAVEKTFEQPGGERVITLRGVDLDLFRAVMSTVQLDPASAVDTPPASPSPALGTRSQS